MSDNEPWVGVWRPHKPRQPIAAQYLTPGPKYKLPAYLGINNRNPTIYKEPAYSFGKRYDRGRPSNTPGPIYLVPANITRNGQDGTPAFSLHSRPRELSLFQSPGPGQYSTERSGKSVFHSSPAYSLSGRNKDANNNQTPGPASYRIVLPSSAPSYSFSGRHKTGSFSEDLKKTPGPAAYNVVDPYVYRPKPPQHSILGNIFTHDPSAGKPGPGAHNPEGVTFTRPKAPSYTFGLRHSQYKYLANGKTP